MQWAGLAVINVAVATNLALDSSSLRHNTLAHVPGSFYRPTGDMFLRAARLNSQLPHLHVALPWWLFLFTAHGQP